MSYFLMSLVYSIGVSSYFYLISTTVEYQELAYL